MLAGDQAEAVFAHEEAERYYRTALEMAGELLPYAVTDDRIEAELLGKLGAVLKVMGRYDDSLEVLERAVALCCACGDASGELRTLAQIGQVHAVRGTPGQGVARLQPLLTTLGAHGPSTALAALHVALAKLYVKSGHYSKQLSAAVQAADLARVVGDDYLLAQAEQERAYALTFLGRVEEGLRVHEEAIVLAEAVGDLSSLCTNLHNVSHVSLLQGEFDLSRRYKDRGLAAAERLGDPVVIAFQTFHRVFTAFWVCDWSEGRQYYERGVALDRQVGVSYLPGYALLVRGLLQYGQGNWEEAGHDLEESSSIAVRTGDLQVLRLAQTPLAERDLLEGHPDAARARLVPLLDRPGVEERDVTLLLPLLAWAYLELGDPVKAEALVAQAISRARAGHFRLMLVGALRVQALIAGRQRRWTIAEDAVTEAVTLARSMGYHYGEARALHMHGLLGIEQTELASARERLQEALAIFQRLGTTKDVERTEQALAQLDQG
jgi:tetratricopeptide (TPR) repeat protein